MRTLLCGIIAAAVAASTFQMQAAHAAGCEDVLIHKVMDQKEYKRDSVFLLTLATQSKDYLKDDISMKTGLDFDIDGLPIGIDSDNARHFEHQITTSLNLSTFQRDSVHYLVQSGQKNIVEAWKDCMSQQGGLVLTFEVHDERSGVLHIDYLTPKDSIAVWPDLTLKETAPIPTDFKINTGMDCLKLAAGKPAHVFKPGSNCDVDFALPADWAKDRAAWTTWSVVIRTKAKDKEISSNTYLAPRAKLVARTKVWPAAPPVAMAGLYAYDHGLTSRLDCKTTDAGYVFLNKFNLRPVETGHGGGNCRVTTAAIQEPGTAFCLTSGLGGIYEKGDYYCHIDVAGTEAKFEFDPAEPNAKSADFASFLSGKPTQDQIMVESDSK